MTTKRHPLGWNQYSDKDPAERIQKHLEGTQYEYIGGYTDRKKPITIRCKACGYEFSRIYEVIFDKRYPGRCPNCIRREREEKATKEKTKALREKGRKRMARYITARRKTVTCGICGKKFKRVNGFGRIQKLYCSEECQHIQQERKRQAANRHHDRRLNKCRVNDRTISVQKLYQRDGGICWICGGMTDPEDRKIREDGTIVCGERYPSIDHVIPISRGGNNVWDNVRLAHRGCNTARGASLPE